MFLSKTVRTIARNQSVFVSQALKAASFSTSYPESFVWPREKEGDIIKVNWSLVEDGVTNTNKAYLHADKTFLSKHVAGDVKPLWGKKEAVLEAGNTLSHDDFSDAFSQTTNYLSSNKVLFVEDHSVGSHKDSHLGVRVITDLAHVAQAVRSLLIPKADRQIDMRARAKGWNLDPRWAQQFPTFDEETGLPLTAPREPLDGQRPIVVFVGGDAVNNGKAAVQFLQSAANNVIVGANIIASATTSMQTIASAIGFSATVILNSSASNGAVVALRDATVHSKAGKTILVLGQSGAGSTVYASDFVALTSSGAVSAVFNGVVGADSVSVTNPDNLVAPVTDVVLASGSAASREEALKAVAAHAEGLTAEQGAQKLQALFNDKVAFHAKDALSKLL